MNAGRELDKLIGEKVFGFHVEQFKGSVGRMEYHYKSGDAWIVLPNYSTHIAAAFIVLQSVCDQMQLGWSIEKHESDSTLYVTLNGQGAGEYWEAKIKSAVASDIPYAICLAALKACQVSAPHQPDP